MSYLILQGDVTEQLRAQPSNSVHCGITSPPYWNLRRYGDSSNELGREPSPAAYVARMVEVFREFRRVLRPDGVLFINIGDSYANDGKWGGSTGGKHVDGLHGNTGVGRERQHSGLKPKDRCLIPHRLVIALQDDGWWVRDEIIWHKPNAMPYSGTDRTTPTHEPIYMLTKSARYFFDNVAIQEPAKASSIKRLGQDIDAQAGSSRANGGEKSNGAMKAVQFGGSKYRDGHTKSGNTWSPVTGRTAFRGQGHFEDGASAANRDGREISDIGRFITANKRSVWTVATGAFSEAHFATFPPALVEPMVLAGTSERGCCPTCGRDVDSVQSWKNGRTFGRYRKQYVYCCPHCGFIVEPYYYCAFNAIDWSLPAQRIGDRARPLKEATLRRVRIGLERFSGAHLLSMKDSANCDWSLGLHEPMTTQATASQHALITPFLIDTQFTHAMNDRSADLRDAMNTQTAQQSRALVVPPFIVSQYNRPAGIGAAVRDLREPLPTVPAMAVHHLVTPPFIVNQQANTAPTAMHEAMATMLASGNHKWIVEPGEAVKVEDCGFRMLEPHECGAAMAFPSDYRVLGGKRDRVKQYGNAVTPPVMAVLMDRVMESLR